MNKSIIIAIFAVWALSMIYMFYARMAGLSQAGYARALAWIASFLMLASIIIFVRKWKGK